MGHKDQDGKAGKIGPNKISSSRRHLGCAPYAKSWVFFQNVQNTAFLWLYKGRFQKKKNNNNNGIFH